MQKPCPLWSTPQSRLIPSIFVIPSVSAHRPHSSHHTTYTHSPSLPFESVNISHKNPSSNLTHRTLSPSLSFRSPMNPTTFSLPLLLLLSALPSSFSDSSDDQQVAECVPGNCGTITNIIYPFWVSNQQSSYCGFPEFKLYCDGDTLYLQTSNIKYYVHKIFYVNHSISVVPVVPELDPGSRNLDCPGYQNPTFIASPFTASLTNMYLFMLYNCSVPQQPFYYKFPCTEYNLSTFLGSNSSELEQFEWFKKCEVVEIPVLGFPGAKASDYNRLVKDGFLLEWSAPDCIDCSSSGGQCGYSVHRDTFMCICKDRTHSRRCKPRSNVRKIVIGVGIGGGILVMCFICCIWYFRPRIMRQPSSSSKFLIQTGSCNADQEMCSNNYRTHVFSYSELHEATNGFDESRELGDGGFGTVYKGQLRDGRVVAVKRLYENNYKRVEQFLNEVDILSRLRHKNLVTLYGCTSRHSRELLLVYEFVANGTVADHLHGPRAPENGLTWGARLNIAIETADALTYLHAIEPQIIHRDVKTNNILLDSSFHVKVADFGLSRLFPVDATHVSTLPQGTPGYVDPEYHQCYQLTDKSDVYSFGVVLVELISSMPAVDISRHRHEINLANLAVTKIQNREIEQLVDPRLGFREDWEIEKMINMVAELAFRCLQGDGDMRPTIKEVLVELKQIENKGEKVVEAGEISDDARLLKSEVPFSPDTVTVRWDSKMTTPNTSA